MFRYDFKINRSIAWLLSAGVPILLFTIGLREFIALVGFVGAVFGGMHGIFIVMTYQRMRRGLEKKHHKCLHIPSLISWIIVSVFLLGMGVEIWRTLIG